MKNIYRLICSIRITIKKERLGFFFKYFLEEERIININNNNKVRNGNDSLLHFFSFSKY